MKGKVKFFNHSKGFGFIVGEDEKEYFVHHTFLVNIVNGEGLDKDVKVTFDPSDSDKGLQAKNVMFDNE